MAQKYFPETQHWLAGGFHDYFMRNGEAEGIYTYGYPISEEFHDEDAGVTVQWFERARFEHRPEIANNEQHVVLGLVGREYIDSLDMAGSEAQVYFDGVASPEESGVAETTE